jgi:cytidylate kinase
MIIAISGSPGTGTTTLAKLISQKLGWPHIYAGQIFRDMALARNLSLQAFSEYAEQHPEIDRELDKRMIETARFTRDAILEGRLSAWQVRQAGVPAIRVHLRAPEEVRAARVADREKKTVEQAMKENREREASEAKRYIAYYGVNPDDNTLYDLVLDSSKMKPDELADVVLKALGR